MLYLRAHHDDLAQVRRALPHLSRTEIESALAYYGDDSWIVDADIE